MAFVRIKRIKNQEYAYFVENTWKDGRSRQRVLAYLGKVLHEPIPRQVTMIPEGTYHAMLDHLLHHTLLLANYTPDEYHYRRQDTAVVKTTKNVLHKGKPAVIRMNEGFFCQTTWDNLRELQAKQTIPSGEELAKRILETGLAITSEQFVQLYEQLCSEINARGPSVHL